MQCILTFNLFVSSSLFFLEVVVKLFHYFWKPNSLFSKFCVNCLLMFYLAYCNNCVLNNVNGTCWSTCSLLALCVPELCLWPAKLEETLNVLRCIHVFDWVLKCGSDVNEGNWLQLLFYFIFLVGIVACVIGMSFCCVSCFRLKFSRNLLWPKRMQSDSKSDFTTNGLILGFFVEKWLLSLT